MNAYEEIFCNQNPKMTLECQNPGCKSKKIFDTKTIIATKKVEYNCPQCGKITTFDFTKTFSDFEKKCKALGIKITK